jgi:hypothetical protein
MPPIEAVKYQVLVMFLIAGGTGLGAVTAVLGGVYRLTDSRHRLRLDRLVAPRARNLCGSLPLRRRRRTLGRGTCAEG